MAKPRWTKESLLAGFESFYKEHGRYPTATEVDDYPFLSSARHIQRTYGGMVRLRQVLGLGGPEDFTKGEYSSKRAKTINLRNNDIEKEIYQYLVGKFGEIAVHREFMFADTKRTRTDFFIYTKDGNFAVDVFYPKDFHNLVGCVNSKLRSYAGSEVLKYPIIFLMMNSAINEERMRNYVGAKRKKLNSNQMIMTIDQLKTYCAQKERHPAAI